MLTFQSLTLQNKIGKYSGTTKTNITNPALKKNDGKSPGDILYELKVRESLENEETGAFLKEDMFVSPQFAIDRSKFVALSYVTDDICVELAAKRLEDSLKMFGSTKYRPNQRHILGDPEKHIRYLKTLKKRAFVAKLKAARQLALKTDRRRRGEEVDLDELDDDGTRTIKIRAKVLELLE